SGDIIEVDAGIYAENVIVGTSVDLRGPNYGISPNGGPRVAEAIVVPAVDAPSSGEIFHIAAGADGTSIRGFVLDGDNPAFASNGYGFGADMHCAEGITTYENNIDDVTIQENIFRNLTYFGVTLFGASYSAPATSGHTIEDNLFQNLGTYDGASGIDFWGGAVLIYNGQYAHITNNVMSNVRMGVQTGNFHSANPGAAIYQEISGNTMSVRRRGIFHNLFTGSPSGLTLSNNNITAVWDANETKWDGILLASLSDATHTVSGNTVNGSGAVPGSIGIQVWNVAASGMPTISGGSIDNVDMGLFLNNYEGYSSDAGSGAHATVSSLPITNAQTGIRVLDSPLSTAHAAVELAIGSGVNANGGVTGLSVENSSASVTSLSDLDFSGQSGDYITLVSNAGDLDATGVEFDGLTGGVASLSQNNAIEDKITHALDDNALGLVRVKTGELFVTALSGSIQNGIDASPIGELLNVDAGTFEEQLNIDKALTIVGAGAGATFVNSPPSLTDFFTTSSNNYPIVFIHETNGVTVQGLTVDGLGRGNANYRFMGIGINDASADITDCDVVNVQNTPFDGSQHGNAIYAWNDASPRTVNFSGCNVSVYQKNGITVNGSQATGHLDGCTATGVGVTGVTAQNGIQFGFGAQGTVSDCTVSGHTYTGGFWGAAGLLAYISPSLVISGCDLSENQACADLYRTNGSITDCVATVTNAANNIGFVVETDGSARSGERL
ncbi:MAG: hypothetical protein KC488_13860, partial [Candidatus Cloacimonetes bacterium]|nr:hypothetical protein [Candidatus Cloacimonadota bacterium]